MGTFAKITIFSFSLVGIFALIFSFIPSAFFQASFESSLGQDRVIANSLSVANVTVYGNTGNDNATYQYSSYHDHPNAPQFSAGLPSGQYLEVWWGEYSPINPALRYMMELRHIHEAWFLVDYVALTDRCEFTDSSGSNVGEQLQASEVESNYDDAQNASVYEARCNHLLVSTMFFYNQTKYGSITDSWNSGEISYILSYEVDWNATGVSAWNIIGQLLTFQNPDLGIMGDGGAILNYIIAIPLMIGIIIAIIYITLALIPFISGLND